MKKTVKIIALLLVAVLAFSCFAGCGKKSVGTLNGKELPADVLKFALFDIITNFEASNGVEFTEIANEKINEELTVYNYIANYAISIVQQKLIVDELFEKYGLEWDETAQEKLAQLIENYYEGNGGEEAAKKNLTDNGLEFSAFEALKESNVKQALLANHFYGPTGERSITDDEVKATFAKDYARIKHILVATVDTTTMQAYEGDKLAEAEAKYAEVEAKVKALAPNDEAGFVALMDKYNEDPGMKSMPDGYVVADNGQFVQAFVDGAFSVGEGEYAFEKSDEYGYHILMRLPTRDTDIITQFGSVSAFIDNYRANLLMKDIEAEMQNAKADINNDAFMALVSEVA